MASASMCRRSRSLTRKTASASRRRPWPRWTACSQRAGHERRRTAGAHLSAKTSDPGWKRGWGGGLGRGPVAGQPSTWGTPDGKPIGARAGTLGVPRVARLAKTGPDQPPSNDADADFYWFAENSARRYRIRDDLIIRRVKGVFLRTQLPAGEIIAGTTESAAEAAWWVAAYPEVSAATREKMVLRARRRAR